MSHPAIPVSAGDDHRHILTVAIEDYYQGATFNRLIPRARWHRFESRLARNTATTLDLLDEYKLKATFFALGWVADAVPELIREVVARGHDIASKGYFHRSIREFSRDEFRDDTVRAREALERASGRQVDGYRVAQRWLRPEDLWALDVLAEEGYKFDSSIRPLFRQYVHEPWRRFVHQHHHGEHTMLEVPVSTTRVMGHDIPIAGANYFRQLPFSLVQRAVRQWDRKYEAPFVMYFHVWELDPDQPKIDAAPFYAKVRQYRNLDRMATMLRYYFEQYRFTSIGDRLGIESLPASEQVLATAAAAAATAHELGPMVTLLTPGVDMVTASPYHKNGKVLNVPEWRLFLSRTLSKMYGMVLHHQLATYTACFRVYRRSTVADVPLSRAGFIGVAELLGRLDLGGSGIVEYPTTLEVRILGRSKMKIVKTMAGHIRLLIELIGMRLFHRSDAMGPAGRPLSNPPLSRSP
jgi:polysaccharide deacetylase family protein (PEP-CTERM system associated)